MEDKIQEYLIRYEELSHDLSDPAVIADREKFQKLAQEYAKVEEIVHAYQEYKAVCDEVAEAKSLLTGDDADLVKLAKQELAELEPKQEAMKKKLEELLAPKDPDDDRNVILEVRAGTGGDEAALFAMDLLRMYTRFSESMGWKVELASINETELGGVKEAVCIISGQGAYRLLKYESGAHRVQRIPATESGGRIHTSAATVAVLPEAADIDVQINPNDLKVETHRSSGSGGQHVNKTDSAVRMVHIPTGIVVSCQDEKSQIKNREKAYKIMQARVLDYFRSQYEKEYSENRKNQIGSGDRSERIRTYNFPQGRVTDHRIGMTLYKLEEFMQGDIEEMLQALVLAAKTGQLGSGEADN